MNETCRQLNSKSGCEFKSKKGLDLISARINNDLMDIEDLVKFGTEKKCCPFYGSRQALPTVDVCVLPYNLLIVPSAREACGIDLKNSVVIIDEAHNLSSAIESAFSVSISRSTLELAYKQLSQVKMIQFLLYIFFEYTFLVGFFPIFCYNAVELN
jgi:chromosome transmission fidelity protein 1